MVAFAEAKMSFATHLEGGGVGYFTWYKTLQRVYFVFYLPSFLSGSVISLKI